MTRRTVMQRLARLAAGTALGVGLVAAGLPSGVASATPMDGYGGLEPEWNDEHTLCSGCSVYRGNVVGVWQQILWADGKLSSECYADGWFGIQTENATKWWQAAEGLSQDGIVGPNTWDRADNNLYWAWEGHVRYQGTTHEVGYLRHYSTGGYYWWNPPGGGDSHTDHPAIDIVGC